jgi:hypothetical protein
MLTLWIMKCCWQQMSEFSEILISVEQKIVKLAEKNKIYNAKMICYTMN